MSHFVYANQAVFVSLFVFWEGELHLTILAVT